MWLLDTQVYNEMAAAIKGGFTVTAEQQAAFEARALAALDEDAPRILAIAGDTAQITVAGMLTAAPSFMAMFFGGANTTYREFIAAVRAAEANPEVKQTHIVYDTPGGHVKGMFDAVAELQAAKKPITSYVSQATSAGYALASQAQRIIAAGRAATVGSIGVVLEGFADPNAVIVTSTNAPKKRPDLRTEEGRAVMREEMDAIHELMVEGIASARGRSIEEVNADFGQGATLLADAALKKGMIDEIAGPALRVVKPSTTKKTTAQRGDQKPEAQQMDLAKLKADYPDVYAAAVNDGVTQERDRVGAFIIAGQSSGDMKTALAAIEDGSQMTGKLSTQFMMAAANRSDLRNRQADDDGAAAALGADAASQEDEATRDKKASDALFANVAETLGVTINA